MENLTVASTIFCPCIVSSLSIVSILLSNGKSNRCFNNLLSLHCRQLIRRFNFFLKWKIKPLSQQCFGHGLRAIYPLFQFLCYMENLTVVSTIFCPFNIGNVTVVSILFSNGKSNRCFNTFLALHYKQSIRFLIFFLSNGKSNLWLNNFLAFSCRQSMRCFNSFLKWEIVPLLQ